MAKQSKKEWTEYRKEGALLTGYPICKYCNLYLPDGNKKLYKVWSLNYTTQRDMPIIYDFPEFDLNWNHRDNPFAAIMPDFRDKLDYYNPNVLHVGRLTPYVIDEIVTKTKGKGLLIDALIEYDGFVFFFPAQFSWKEEGYIKKDDINPQGNYGKLLALLACTATFIN